MTAKTSASAWEKMFKEADTDNSGTLDVMELRTMLRKGNSNMTDSQIAVRHIVIITLATIFTSNLI